MCYLVNPKEAAPSWGGFLFPRSTRVWSREAVLSRHTSTALSMVAASASAAAPGIYHSRPVGTPASPSRQHAHSASWRRLPIPSSAVAPLSKSASGYCALSGMQQTTAASLFLPHGGCDPPALIRGLVFSRAAYVLPAAGGEPPGGFGGNMERECRDTWAIPLHPPL